CTCMGLGRYSHHEVYGELNYGEGFIADIEEELKELDSIVKRLHVELIRGPSEILSAANSCKKYYELAKFAAEECIQIREKIKVTINKKISVTENVVRHEMRVKHLLESANITIQEAQDAAAKAKEAFENITKLHEEYWETADELYEDARVLYNTAEEYLSEVRQSGSGMVLVKEKVVKRAEEIIVEYTEIVNLILSFMNSVYNTEDLAERTKKEAVATEEVAKKLQKYILSDPSAKKIQKTVEQEKEKEQMDEEKKNETKRVKNKKMRKG
ncbi:uncharacterized protein TM35_000821010, partial [Trypanosoma theileri]